VGEGRLDAAVVIIGCPDLLGEFSLDYGFLDVCGLLLMRHWEGVWFRRAVLRRVDKGPWRRHRGQ